MYCKIQLQMKNFELWYKRYTRYSHDRLLKQKLSRWLRFKVQHCPVSSYVPLPIHRVAPQFSSPLALPRNMEEVCLQWGCMPCRICHIQCRRRKHTSELSQNECQRKEPCMLRLRSANQLMKANFARKIYRATASCQSLLSSSTMNAVLSGQKNIKLSCGNTHSRREFRSHLS